MKKLVLAAAVSILLLAGCSLIRSSELLEAADLARPLPEEFTQCELYNQAVHSGSIVLYQGEPITTSAMAYSLLEGLDKKGNTLEIYVFASDGGSQTCQRILYRNEDGVLREYTSLAPDWITSAEPEAVRTVTQPEITRYGFFTALAEDGQPCGLQVVNNSELYSNMAELQELYDTYFRPIGRSAIGLDTWSSPEEAADLLWLAEDIAAYGGLEFREEYPDGWIPVNYLVETLSGYFDGITRRSVVYTIYDFDYPSDCMHYTFGRDYDAPPSYVRVLSAHQQEDILRISYCLDSPYSGEPLEDSSRVLTVKQLDDGSFRYMSNLMA